MDARDLDRLERALPVGKANGTTQRTIARWLGWNPDGRKVRAGIQLLRRERHIPVVSLPQGNSTYILADDSDLAALKRSRDGLRPRAMKQLVTVKDMDQMIAEIEYSPTLFAREVA